MLIQQSSQWPVDSQGDSDNDHIPTRAQDRRILRKADEPGHVVEHLRSSTIIIADQSMNDIDGKTRVQESGAAVL